MIRKSRTDLKRYFQTGNTPTQEQFADLIDSCLMLEEDGVRIDGNANITINNESSTAKLEVSGKVVAAEFQGSGQDITNLNPKNFQELITSDQIQSLDATKLQGAIAPENIAGLKLYLDKPNINGEETVTLTWSSHLVDKVILEYVFENEILREEWNNNLDQEKTYQLKPYQTNTYVLTTYKEDIVQGQKQFTVQVIPNEFQYLKKLYDEGIELSSALDSCVKRYRLLPFTKESIDRLIDAVQRTQYSETDALTLLQKWSESKISKPEADTKGKSTLVEVNYKKYGMRELDGTDTICQMLLPNIDYNGSPLIFIPKEEQDAFKKWSNKGFLFIASFNENNGQLIEQKSFESERHFGRTIRDYTEEDKKRDVDFENYIKSIKDGSLIAVASTELGYFHSRSLSNYEKLLRDCGSQVKFSRFLSLPPGGGGGAYLSLFYKGKPESYKEKSYEKNRAIHQAEPGNPYLIINISEEIKVIAEESGVNGSVTSFK
ncbi:MAG: hypothetical protein RMY29_012000 [Nostoc sp. CreGUA01]|nr:interleukin-like EMT inducer domain-containing protein [Nostoc sp. CreGUA01]